MVKSHHKLLLLVVALALLFVFASVYSIGPRNPKLMVVYLARTNDSVFTIARFAITNVGNSAAISFSLGQIEVLGQGQKVMVSYRSKLHRLAPGKGDVIEVFLPPGLQGRWRFIPCYAHEGVRSRISTWQWGPGGPGPRANKFIPQFLKGAPLDVKATSDWID